jgi:hypothetical protein
VALQTHVPLAHVDAPAQVPDATSFHCPVASQYCGVFDAHRVGVGLGRQTPVSETTSDELSVVVASALSGFSASMAVSLFASWDASVAPSLETSSASASALWPPSDG